ncbi:MAG: serine/threonine-protein kinase [Solirubrobacterales bacterium]
MGSTDGDASGGDEDLVADRYRLGRKLGTGGMASVYEAYDTSLDRTVALKRLRTDAIDEHVDRFRREARIGANLNHPNLVIVYDIIIAGDDVLIAMEHVEGRSLADLVAEGPVQPERAIEILTDVAAALGHAHDAGVVHRDVKPANILLARDGRAKVVDLGIAAAAEETRLTESHQVIGTLTYMAPERLSGDGVGGPAADVYSLAMVALEMLSGDVPWRGLNPSQRLSRAERGSPDLAEIWPQGPSAARAALERALDPDPDQRQPSPGALVDELADGLALDSEVASSEPTATMPMAAASAGSTAATDRQARTSSGPAAVGDRASEPLGKRAPISEESSGPSPRALVLALASVAALAVAAVVAFALTGGGSGEDGRSASSGDRGSAAGSGSEQADGSESGSTTAPEETTTTTEPEPDSGGSEAEDSQDVTRFAEGGPEDDAKGAALNDQGFALIQQGQPKKAVPVLQRSVKAFRADTDSIQYAFALFNLGNALVQAGRPDEAIPILEARLQIPEQTGTVQAKLDEARAAAG